MSDEPQSFWAKLAVITAFLTALAGLATLVSERLIGNEKIVSSSPLYDLHQQREEQTTRLAEIKKRQQDAEQQLLQAELDRQAAEAAIRQAEANRVEAEQQAKLAEATRRLAEQQLNDPGASHQPSLLIPTVTPSFDCAKATYESEHIVCSTPELAMLDRTIFNAYHHVIARMPYRKLELKKTQIDWIKRTRFCRDVPCLRQEYKQRLSELAEQ